MNTEHFKTLVEACPLAILSLILLTFNLLETLPTTLEEALSAILPPFKASVENNLGYNIESTPNYQNTAINAAMGLHDDGKTGYFH
jgi:hypothetical protein